MSKSLDKLKEITGRTESPSEQLTKDIENTEKQVEQRETNATEKESR